jgi:hypothetical protein
MSDQLALPIMTDLVARTGLMWKDPSGLETLGCTIAGAMPDEIRDVAEIVDALERAQRTVVTRRKRLVGEINRLDKLTDELDRTLKALRQPGASTVDRQPGPRSRIKPVIEEVLRAARGSPVHATDILEAVRARGIPLSAKDPKATIVTALIRMDRQRAATGAREGVKRMGGNQFVWVVEGSGPPSEPEQPSALSPGALLALASQPEHARP